MGPFGWDLAAAVAVLAGAVDTEFGDLTTSPQNEGVAEAVLFQGLAASGAGAAADEEVQDWVPGGPFQMAACANVIVEGEDSNNDEAVCE